MNQSSTIVLEHRPSLDADYLDELVPYLEPLSQDIKIIQKDPGMYAAVEWLFPATVAIVLFGLPVLNGFLQELGASGARTLKSALKNVFKRTKEQNAVWMNSSELDVMEARRLENPDEPVRNSDFGRQGPVLSLGFHLSDMGNVVFIFLHGLGETEFENALLALPNKLSEATRVLRKRLAISADDYLESVEKGWSLNLDRRLNYVYLVEQSMWLDAEDGKP